MAPFTHPQLQHWLEVPQFPPQSSQTNDTLNVHIPTGMTQKDEDFYHFS